MYITRHLQEKVNNVTASWPVILLTGPRQAGKTTMLRHLASLENTNREYITLDNTADLEMAREDPKLFFEFHAPPVLIDEVQYAPQLFREIKRLADLRQQPGDFWLTGSQIFSMMEGVQESLAGRAAVLHMSPLSQRELLGEPVKPFIPTLERLSPLQDCFFPAEMYRRLWTGSMPGLASGMRPDRDLFYASYIQTYLQRDVRDLAGTVEALKFHQFLRAAAARAGQIVNYSALAVDADINEKTCRAWLHILEALGIIFLLHPYSDNVLKRTVRTPKLYFFDTGLVCYLTRWLTPETAAAGAMSDALLENFVISEILKGYQNSGLDPGMYYYRDRDGKEIDLLLEADNTLYPAEIKKSTHPDRRLFSAFRTLRRSERKLGAGCVLCLTDRLSGYASDQLIVPIGGL